MSNLPKILVTGGSGYIGSHVIYTLQQTRRYKVISLDNGHNSHSNALDRVSALSRSELPENASEQEIETTVIENHSCDLTRRDEIRAVFEKYGKGGIWGVVHIAAYKAVGESVEIPLTYYENNVAATLYLLQVMNEFDCTRIVYSSSATVYGIPPTIPIPESTRLKADSPYGKTKVACETMIDDLCHCAPLSIQLYSRRFRRAVPQTNKSASHSQTPTSKHKGVRIDEWASKGKTTVNQRNTTFNSNTTPSSAAANRLTAAGPAAVSPNNTSRPRAQSRQNHSITRSERGEQQQLDDEFRLQAYLLEQRT
ncbi:THO complex subunit 1 [Mycena indigotica]|uniref:THO complex subunit 1 n=1 Tax=Mycena indigotica TaxID=2126181 RepID=A0A8H6SWJ8_9AGAR|nr:THO complex subunit 1 [Mycena indigotica]KAF7307258.1 THO complex subunit 1 [Mycena indigotica]